jgi:hypothetical protein
MRNASIISSCLPETVNVPWRYLMPDPTPAYRSRLINYLDEIRRLRRARQTWRAIAEYLGNNYGVQITAGGVHIFFKRATRRKQAPLGFEDSPITCQPLSAAPNGSPHVNVLTNDQRPPSALAEVGGNETAGPGPSAVKPLPAWFPRPEKPSRLTDEDLSWDPNPLKRRKTK